MNKDTRVTQQFFLRKAMRTLSMTREQFAKRIGTNKRRLDNWLLPSTSSGFREMDEIVWSYIKEILTVEQSKKQFVTVDPKDFQK